MQEAHFNVDGKKSYPSHFAVQIYHAIKSSTVFKHTSCYANIKTFFNLSDLNRILDTEEQKSYNLLCVSIYLALSFLPPKRAAAAFLKKFLAGLDKWKSGTV